MEILTLKEFAEEIVTFNTFIVNGQLCLGGVFTNNFEKDGIFVTADILDNIVWIVEDWKLRFFKEVTKEQIGDRTKYKILYDKEAYEKYVIHALYNKEEHYQPIEVIAYNRPDIGTILIKGELVPEQLATLDIFDDSISFIENDKAVIGLDLRKLKMDRQNAYKLGLNMVNKACPLNDSALDGSYTFCLSVDMKDYTFGIYKLEINTLKLGLFNIIEDRLHSNSKIKEYVQKMKTSYDQVWNSTNKVTLMRELCELLHT